MHLCLPFLCEEAVLKKTVVGVPLKIDFHIWKSRVYLLQGLCKILYMPSSPLGVYKPLVISLSHGTCTRVTQGFIQDFFVEGEEVCGALPQYRAQAHSTHALVCVQAMGGLGVCPHPPGGNFF